MSKLRFLTAAAAVAALVFSAGPARATTLPPSCVDLNNNGVCDAGEPALGPLLNFGSFDTSVAVPGYVPPAGLVGVVLNNFPLTEDGLSIHATGTIHVNGKMKNPLGGDVDLESSNSIIFGIGAQIQYGQTHDGAGGLTLLAGSIDFGAKTRIKVGGDGNFWDVEADQIHVGTSAKFEAKGDDTEIDVLAISSLTFGGSAQFKTSNSGAISMLAQSSWAATGLKVTAGWVDVEADSPDGLSFAPQRTLSLTNCNLNQDSPDGSLLVSAGSPGFHSASDALTFTHCRVRSASGDSTLQPTPIIQ